MFQGVVSSMKESFGFIERADKVSEVRFCFTLKTGLIIITSCYLYEMWKPLKSQAFLFSFLFIFLVDFLPLQ